MHVFFKVLMIVIAAHVLRLNIPSIFAGLCIIIFFGLIAVIVMHAT